MRNLILSGGPAHDYARTSAMLTDILSEAGVTSEIHEDFDVVENGRIQEFDVLTLNCARTTFASQAQWREEWGFELSGRARREIRVFLRRGKGLLALHAAALCFDDWPEFREILGAWWEWGYTTHPAIQEHGMRVRTDAHPVVDGIEDFTIFDELYINLRLAAPIEPLMESDWEGSAHPMLWVREHGPARIFYCALGHGPEAFANPAYRSLIQHGAQWVTERPRRNAS